jgi:hypothetical protein
MTWLEMAMISAGLALSILVVPVPPEPLIAAAQQIVNLIPEPRCPDRALNVLRQNAKLSPRSSWGQPSG